MRWVDKGEVRWCRRVWERMRILRIRGSRREGRECEHSHNHNLKNTSDNAL